MKEKKPMTLQERQKMYEEAMKKHGLGGNKEFKAKLDRLFKTPVISTTTFVNSTDKASRK